DVRYMRITPGACVPGWPQADRRALLHQLRLTRFREEVGQERPQQRNPREARVSLALKSSVAGGHGRLGRRRRTAILRLVARQQLPSLFECERGSIDDELIVTGVVRDLDDSLDRMAALSEGLNDQLRIHR